MRRFLRKLFPFAVWIFVLMVILPVCIDPYNVFHREAPRDNGVEPNKNFLKTSYVLSHPDQFDAFLFGSSRVSSIHSDKIEGYRCYNMTYSEGIPEEHRQNLEEFLKNGIRPRMVMVGVDNLAFLVDPKLHLDSLQRMPYPRNLKERVRFYISYLEPIMAVDSLKTTYLEPRVVSYDSNLYETGWTLDYDAQSHTDWSQAQADWTYQYQNRTDEALEEIRRLKQLCDDNGIRLILFTNPMHPLTFQKAVENGYGEFLLGLSEITEFYNFSGRNNVTDNNDNFLETSHYKANVGDMILDVIFRGAHDAELEKQWFGVLITSENAEDFVREITNDPVT